MGYTLTYWNAVSATSFLPWWRWRHCL